MPPEEQAAVRIQSRFRGFQWRRKQRRRIQAVTRVQALQRGRFTRREFAQLREFSREQEGFQQATRRRQLRIWRNEQELYFLQHTTAAELERVRAFQQQRSARVIQRSWRAVSSSIPQAAKHEDSITDPSDRIFTFNPFGIETTGFSHWSLDGQSCSKRVPSLLLTADDIRNSSVRHSPASIADEEEFATRRKALRERIKRKVAQEHAESDTRTQTETSKSQANRRRDLYDQLVAMQHSTAQRLLQYDRDVRSKRFEQEIGAAQHYVSCNNRVRHLLEESPEGMTMNNQSEDYHDKMECIEEWNSSRRARAWNHHRRAVRSVLDKRHWWQTQLAGAERDIRQVLVAKSPWEDENNIWVWPRGESDNQSDDERGASKDDNSTAGQTAPPPWPSEEIRRFLASDATGKAPQTSLTKDHEASEWWRAHCTQSHLAIHGGLVVVKPFSAEFTSNVDSEGDNFPVCTGEAVANRDLYNLQQNAERRTRLQNLDRDVEQRVKALTVQVQRQVHDMEAEVESNTQQALELIRRKEEHRARITREQKAVVTIQRHARGMQGRRVARDRHAEFFVMVRGRAIRRGRCEECGDERAVLECQQCEEGLHFCPLCWVHVHSTRRRKTHVAIPMTVVAPVAALAPVRETIESVKNPTPAMVANKPCVESTATPVPKLRSLPSPLKKQAVRPAKPTATTVAKQEKVTNETTPRETGSSSELAEAYALARRVRSEVAEASAAAMGIRPEAIRTIVNPRDSSDDDQFPVITGDNATVDDFEEQTFPSPAVAHSRPADELLSPNDFALDVSIDAFTLPKVVTAPIQQAPASEKGEANNALESANTQVEEITNAVGGAPASVVQVKQQAPVDNDPPHDEDSTQNGDPSRSLDHTEELSMKPDSAATPSGHSRK